MQVREDRRQYHNYSVGIMKVTTFVFAITSTEWFSSCLTYQGMYLAHSTPNEGFHQDIHLHHTEALDLHILCRIPVLHHCKLTSRWTIHSIVSRHHQLMIWMKFKFIIMTKIRSKFCNKTSCMQSTQGTRHNKLTIFCIQIQMTYIFQNVPQIVKIYSSFI